MRIALVNVSGRMSTDGSRLVSALLKRAGHEVKAVFLSRRSPMLYEERELALLDGMFAESGAVMISVYSSYVARAVQVTDYIHRRHPGRKVFWGGPHCISVPDVGLEHADGICFSEGDEAVVELAARLSRGDDWTETPNFSFRAQGKTVTNRVLPPFRDLDSLPYYDYDLAGQFMLDRELIPMTMELLKARMASFPYRTPIFYFMTSRGCPHNCAYCNNCRYLALWGKVPIRMHSVERVIAELEFQLARLGFIEFVGFGDDDFFVRPAAELEQFAASYSRRVRLPFGVAVSARTYRREKLDILLGAGLKIVQMGVQSGSQRVLDTVFNRTLGVERTRAAGMDMATAMRTHGMDLALDFIIDNPYETRDDAFRTFRYIRELPPKVQLNVFYLAYFPGTPLYERALADGIISPASREIYKFWARTSLRYQRNWETVLIILTRFLRLATKGRSSAVEAFLRAAGSRPVRVFMSILPGAFFSAFASAIQGIVLSQARKKERASLGTGEAKKPAA
jgi:anaerobic magnesium-protoporphyrin IX monomethyl ester cyclase